MDVTGGQDDGRKESRRSGKKKPQKMQFMFIDSTDHGTNAKPNKAVRSFVMHQARRQKPWSTRQKPQSPDEEESAATGLSPGARHAPPYLTHSRAEDASPPGPGSWKATFDPSSSWTAQSISSPVSSRASSFSTSSRNGSLSTIYPPSSHHGSSSSICNLPDCEGDTCTHTSTALVRGNGFALGVLDPFDCLPVRTDAKMSRLLDHFVSVMSPHLLTVDIHRSSTKATMQWLSSSLQNTTAGPFTYALLTGSALQLQALGKFKLGDTLYYKAQAISEINKLLSDPTTSIDDNNIAAVFMLLTLEESQIAPGKKSDDDQDWSETQRAVHLHGLRTMIQQRGGLAALNSNQCLQVFILMHSVAHSISTFQDPYTTLLDAAGEPQKYDLPSFRSRPSSARILRLFRDLKLDADLFEIINNIIVFTGDLSAWFDDSRCPVEPLELQKHVCLLIYRLYDWYRKETPEQQHTPIDQSICLALIIFLVRSSHPFHPGYQAMIITSVKKLRASMTKGSIFRWAKSPDLLLWALTIGALAAQGTTEASFFSQYCSVAFADAGFDDKTSAEELLDRMKNCLWIPVVFDNEVKKLWAHMGLAKGVEEAIPDEGELDGLLSPEIKEDDVVGLLTSARFFSEPTTKKMIGRR